MSALPAGALSGLRAGLATLNVQTLSYQVRSAGAWATAVNFSAVVTEDGKAPLLDAPKKMGRRTIRVRPTASSQPVSVHDRVIYDGATFTIDDISGADIQVLICSNDTKVGIQANDRPRFSGA